MTLCRNLFLHRAYSVPHSLINYFKYYWLHIVYWRF